MFEIQSYGDVALGVGASLVVFGLYKIRSFMYIRPCEDIQRVAKAPIKQIGDNNTITVWGFHKAGEYPTYSKGICDGSPYVARVCCYLRLLGKDYVKAVSVDLSENPRTKLPFVNLYGTMIDDSGRILEAIQQHFQIDPHEGLTQEQIVQGHLIRRMMTGSFYWIRYCMNFLTDIGQKAVFDGMEGEVPKPLLAFIGPMVINSQVANIMGQGIGRIPLEEIIEMGKADLRTLSAILGNDNQFILGTKEATVYDTDVYAFLSHLLVDTTPASMIWVQEMKRELPNLVNYVDRMRNLLFPELKTKTN